MFCSLSAAKDIPFRNPLKKLTDGKINISFYFLFGFSLKGEWQDIGLTYYYELLVRSLFLPRSPQGVWGCVLSHRGREASKDWHGPSLSCFLAFFFFSLHFLLVSRSFSVPFYRLSWTKDLKQNSFILSGCWFVPGFSCFGIPSPI